ncbi:MFS transporter [Nocardioides lijunqiniae]|uniref:MFS transporter n=1 Tax=Nocardioides lijunqiniae TaxID=2760832 RepID=UPI001877BA3B
MPTPTASTSSRPPAATFVRGGPTVLSYAALLCFAFWVYGYGPALSLLRDELHFSYTMLGVYTAAWSAGTVVTGLCFPAVARRLPRATLLWGSALLAVGGLALFVLGQGVATTLAGGAVLGVGGTMLLTAIQSLLSDTHGEQRDRALVEANIGAALCAVAAPLALGAMAAGSAGWRTAFALPALALLALFVRFRRLPLPPTSRVESGRPGPLPAACWLYAGLAAASMAVEFCLAYFGTEELKDTGLTTSAAVLAMSSHYVGLLVGRVAGSVATRRPGRTTRLLWASLAATAVGFGLFWLAPAIWVAVVGLFVAGLGIANLYPLAVALSLAAAPGREDQANSRSQLLGGILVVTAPYLLGRLADSVGLTWAFTIEPVLIALCVVLLVAGRRAERSTASQAEGA